MNQKNPEIRKYLYLTDLAEVLGHEYHSRPRGGYSQIFCRPCGEDFAGEHTGSHDDMDAIYLFEHPITELNEWYCDECNKGLLFDSYEEEDKLLAKDEGYDP